MNGVIDADASGLRHAYFPIFVGDGIIAFDSLDYFASRYGRPRQWAPLPHADRI